MTIILSSDARNPGECSTMARWQDGKMARWQDGKMARHARATRVLKMEKRERERTMHSIAHGRVSRCRRCRAVNILERAGNGVMEVVKDKGGGGMKERCGHQRITWRKPHLHIYKSEMCVCVCGGGGGYRGGVRTGLDFYIVRFSSSVITD